MLSKTSTRACALMVCVLFAASAAFADSFSFNSDKVLLVNGTRKVFPIGLTTPPPPNATTPTLKNAYQELRDGGVTFIRTGLNTTWDAAGLAIEKSYEDAAAAKGLRCQLWLRDLAKSNSASTDATLKNVINTFKNHAGLGFWKGDDEPQLAGSPVSTLTHVYNIIKSLDTKHPVWIVQAPRGTAAQLAPYDATLDVTGMDIYPVSYPPGIHSLGTNHEISMVGDFTDLISAGSKKPIWMTLQIAWSGVIPPGHRIRFPTLPQERFMVYQAIIHGARGLQFFGGNLTQVMNPTDAKFGWNWTFWNGVLKPILAEVGEKSTLQPALCAPKATYAIKANNGVELTARETSGTSGHDLYIFACKREGSTAGAVQVTISGVPAGYSKGEVLFESPQTVNMFAGIFNDYFAPFDVHVYHFHR